MVAESQHLELYLPLRLVRSPLWQYQRNHAYPFFRSASFVVYICVPSVNYTVASSLTDQGLPTHQMMTQSNPLHLIAPTSTSQETSTAIAPHPCLSILSQRIIRRLYMCAKRKLHSSKLFDRSGPSHTPYGGGESTSTAIAPTSTSQDTSTAIATQPCLSILSQRIIRRLYMCAKRKLHSSKLFDRSGPSHTPYGGGESTSTAHSSHFD